MKGKAEVRDGIKVGSEKYWCHNFLKSERWGLRTWNETAFGE